MSLRDLHDDNARRDAELFDEDLEAAKRWQPGRYGVGAASFAESDFGQFICQECRVRKGHAPTCSWSQPRTHDLPGAGFGRVDLGPIVRGEHEPATPTMFIRSDGRGLLYRNGRHDIHGEPGSGKSMAAGTAVAEELANGGRVVMLDYEATGDMFVERGLALGVPADVLGDPTRVAYFNPAFMNSDEIIMFAKMLEPFMPTLLVIDAVGPAMGRQGLDENDNPDVARWHARFVEPIRAGVTLLLIDHVSRDRQGRQRGGRGGWMKLQLLDVSYGVKTFKAFSRTQEGSLKLSCAKDRFGTYAIGDIVADLYVTPHDNGEHLDIDVNVPGDRSGGRWRPTGLMEKLSKELERRTAADDFPDRTDTLDLISGRAQYRRKALADLVSGGYAEDFQDGRHRRYRSLRPYREADDEGPDDGPEPGSDDPDERSLRRPRTTVPTVPYGDRDRRQGTVVRVGSTPVPDRRRT